MATSTIKQSTAPMPIYNGTVTEVQSIATSGVNVSFVPSANGWYAIKVVTGNTSGNAFARFTINNNIIMQVAETIGVYDTFIPSPVFLKANADVRAMAGFPANASASVIKIA